MARNWADVIGHCAAVQSLHSSASTRALYSLLEPSRNAKEAASAVAESHGGYCVMHAGPFVNSTTLSGVSGNAATASAGIRYPEPVWVGKTMTTGNREPESATVGGSGPGGTRTRARTRTEPAGVIPARGPATIPAAQPQRVLLTTARPEHVH